MDKLIPIEITSAKIDRIQITFGKDEDLPGWAAEVSLLMQDNSRLTSITVSCEDWRGKDHQAERSVNFIGLAGELRDEINKLVTQHINKFQKRLEAPCES